MERIGYEQSEAFMQSTTRNSDKKQLIYALASELRAYDIATVAVFVSLLLAYKGGGAYSTSF